MASIGSPLERAKTGQFPRFGLPLGESWSGKALATKPALRQSPPWDEADLSGKWRLPEVSEELGRRSDKFSDIWRLEKVASRCENGLLGGRLCLYFLLPLNTPMDTMRHAPQEKKEKNGAAHLLIQGARVHNLQNIAVALPHDQLTVVVGVSGSGKSSLVFDIIYAEARRRYIETLENNYARYFLASMEQADVDEVIGLRAPIGIAQETTTRRSGRSTIGTLTEIYAYLRLLYARIGEAYSYLSGARMKERSTEDIEREVLRKFMEQEIMILAPLIRGRKGHYQQLFKQLQEKKFEYVRINKMITPMMPDMHLDRYKTHDIDLVIRKSIKADLPHLPPLKKAIARALKYGQGSLMIGTKQAQFFYFSRALMDPSTGLSYPEPSPNTFSFNSKYGACPTCQGFGEIPSRRIAPFILDEKRSIAEGGIAPLGPRKRQAIFTCLDEFLTAKGYSLETPIAALPEEIMREIIYGTVAEGQKTLRMTVMEWLEYKWTKQRMEELVATHYEVCPDCGGSRLQRMALHFRIHGQNIAELAALPLADLHGWLAALPSVLTEKQKTIGSELLKGIEKRVQLLLDMGLGYLTLDRPLHTLSSGEIRRIRLATQIGKENRYLVGLLYVLDEPSIGLHPRDNEKLLRALQALRDMGNTVIVIEHDKETMLAADYLLEVGPDAGVQGGTIVAAGTPEEFLRQPSVTADFLREKRAIPIPPVRKQGNGKAIVLKGCRGHNLKGVDMTLPLGKLVVVTGVSGSGKSTLINQTLLPALKRNVAKLPLSALPHSSIEGLEHIDKVIEIDQTPIGRTSRSNPATYTGLFTLIRSLFALLPQSKMRGYKVGRFSFNTPVGCCASCKGAGVQLIEMSFLPSMRVTCPTCQGRRYDRETLQVKYKGKSIANVLDMTVRSALSFFQEHPRIVSYLRTLEEVGLGYVPLGQHAPTLSGGEGQRIKLSTELHRKDTGKTLYILDEPTTGLHFKDIDKLLKILQRLVTKGNTVIVIEHNMDVIKVADHIIDLGPEAGDQGGQIIAAGSPEEVARVRGSHTALFLAQELRKKETQPPRHG